MAYTLNQLHIFLKISQTQSVTKAAHELRLTQPAVSIQLKHFQGYFKFPLTKVVGRKIYITDFGREIAEAGERIMTQVEMIDYKALACKGILTGKLRISVVSTGAYVMPSFLSSFIRQHETVEVVMNVANNDGLIDSLETDTCDFSLVSAVPVSLKVEKMELFQAKLYLIGSCNHKLKKRFYGKEIFEESPLIYCDEGSDIRQAMDDFIDRYRVPVVKNIQLATNEAVKHAVMTGLGYSIMPLIGIKNELQNGDLKIIPVSGLPIRKKLNLIWLKGKEHSPAAKEFLQHLKKKKDAIVRKQFAWCQVY